MPVTVYLIILLRCLRLIPVDGGGGVGEGWGEGGNLMNDL